MIIWLASYPKSGNTWVRIFLNALLYSDENSPDINNIKIRQFPLRSDFKGLNINVDNVKDFAENCLACQDKLNLNNSIKIFKTHNALWKTGNYEFTNKENTLGVIHIVRDPRNIITSLKNFYDKQDYNEVFNFMINEKFSIGSKSGMNDMDLPTIVSSWSNHYKSWKKMNKNYLLIKYENLVNEPNNEFRKIFNFMKKNYLQNLNSYNLDKLISECKFDNFKKQEEKYGFKEMYNKNKFFYLGPKNQWNEFLDIDITKKIENAFHNEMLELKYL